MKNLEQPNKDYVKDFKKKDGDLDMGAIRRDIDNTEKTGDSPHAFEKLVGQAQKDYLMIEMKEKELKELKEKILTTEQKDYLDLSKEIHKSIYGPIKDRLMFYPGADDQITAA